jgi:hypothetical protein
MKTITKTKFQKWTVIQLSGALYVNFFVEKSIYIVLDGVRFYKIKKAVLRRMGMRFATRKKPALVPPSLRQAA